MSTTPRLVVAAPASGAGKTTVATGLMAALARRGLRVSPHKVGPDYIDPGYHALATGHPGRNLDPYLTGEDSIAPLFRHGARGSDIAVVEGVTGLYDGAAGAAEFASTAQVAKLLDAPVVLVVDAASQGRSVAALVHGFASYDPEVRIAGIVLNRVGSFRHECILREAVTSVGLRVYGVLYRESSHGVSMPSRHLGLVPAAERSTEAVDTVHRLGELVGECCDLDGLLALARTAGPLTAEPWDPHRAVRASECQEATRIGKPDGSSVRFGLRSHPSARSSLRGASPIHAQPEGTDEPYSRDPQVPEGSGARWRESSHPSVAGAAGKGAAVRRRARPRVAVFGGSAFTFSYAETAELLDAAGAEVVPVDPLHDEGLPEGTRGLVVGGGFPEIYADELSANASLRGEVAAFASAGGVINAECAGLLYLAREFDGRPMCGVIDAAASMTGRLTLGYRDAVAITDSYLARAGERVPGHEFHRTAVSPGAGEHPAWQWSTEGPEGFVRETVHASYLHTHWAGRPRLARRFVEACA